MIFTNMAYPGKDYRVQVFDAWLGETFEPMDNPKDGDKIVKRELVDGVPTVSETKVYSNGSWVDEGSGGGGYKTARVTVVPNEYASLSIDPGEDSGYLGFFDNGTSFHTGLYADGETTTETLVFLGDSVSCAVWQTVDSIVGDAVWDAENSVLIISGDCTLNISGS